MFDYKDPAMKYAYAIAIMINEEAYDIAKRFIDHLQERKEPRPEGLKSGQEPIIQEIHIEDVKVERPEPEKPKPEDLKPSMVKPRKKPERKKLPKHLEKIVRPDNYEFMVDKENDLIVVTYRPSNARYRFSFSEVKRLYDALPEEFTTKDMVLKAREIGIKLLPILAPVLIRVFAHVEFDAEIRRRGRQLMAVKMSDGYLREENRNKLKIEAETIGTPYKVES
jgi:hypothetical protein